MNPEISQIQQMAARRRMILSRTKTTSHFLVARPTLEQVKAFALKLGVLGNGDGGGASNDAAKIEAAYIGYRRDFVNKLKTAAPMYESLFEVVDDDREQNVQIWLHRSPKMRRWTGEKQLHVARAESHPIGTEKYEASELVPSDDILNDRFGLYQGWIEGLADSYDNALDELAFSFLIAGIAGTSLGTTYDGQALIDTDHVMRSVDAGVVAKQQSNKVTGALAQSTFVTALQRFNDMVDEWGNPLNVIQGKRLYLVHGPANDHAAKLIVDQTTQATGEQNVYRGRVIDVSCPRITGTEWAVLPEGSSAVIVHRKSGPKFLAVDNPGDSWVFDTGKFKYGIESEQGAAYGLWQEIVGGPGS